MSKLYQIVYIVCTFGYDVTITSANSIAVSLSRDTRDQYTALLLAEISKPEILRFRPIPPFIFPLQSFKITATKHKNIFLDHLEKHFKKPVTTVCFSITVFSLILKKNTKLFFSVINSNVVLKNLKPHYGIMGQRYDQYYNLI